MLMRRAGFTLIELSIVLVIIALITGGILVAKDMIETARVRAQVTQITQYTAAYNVFRTRYGGLPGDIVSTRAEAIGLTPRAGSPGRGDGNGIYTSCTGGTQSAVALGCEAAMVWNDMTFTDLVPGEFPNNLDNATTITPDAVGNTLPAGKIPGTYLTIHSHSDGTSNFYLMGMEGDITDPVDYGVVARITCSQAHAIDSKIDDGMSGGGMTRSYRFAKGSSVMNPQCYSATGYLVVQGQAPTVNLLTFRIK